MTDETPQVSYTVKELLAQQTERLVRIEQKIDDVVSDLEPRIRRLEDQNLSMRSQLAVVAAIAALVISLTTLFIRLTPFLP